MLQLQSGSGNKFLMTATWDIRGHCDDRPAMAKQQQLEEFILRQSICPGLLRSSAAFRHIPWRTTMGRDSMLESSAEVSMVGRDGTTCILV